MTSQTRWQDWSNAALGIYALCILVFVTGSRSGGAIWSAAIFGVLILSVALWALARPQSIGAEWTQVIVAVLYAATPFTLEYTNVNAAAMNAHIVGILAAVLAYWALIDMSRRSDVEDETRRFERIK